MKQRTFVNILILLMLPLYALPLLDIPHDTVMEATEDTSSYNGICISPAGVKAGLRLAHNDCNCCYMGLWNGGRINGDAQMFESVKVGDWADIVTSDYHIIVECVDVSYAMEGFIRADGDVLVCVRTWIPFVRKVYRFVRL